MEPCEKNLMERIDTVQTMYADLMELLVQSVAEETLQGDPELLDDQIEHLMDHIEESMRDLRDQHLDLSA